MRFPSCECHLFQVPTSFCRLQRRDAVQEAVQKALSTGAANDDTGDVATDSHPTTDATDNALGANGEGTTGGIDDFCRLSVPLCEALSQFWCGREARQRYWATDKITDSGLCPFTTVRRHEATGKKSRN